MDIEEIIENFTMLEDWEDRYVYLIELGNKLPDLDEKFKTEEWKVRGCQSQVWLVPQMGETITFQGDSDAAIVRGLIAVVLSIYNNKSSSEIKGIEVADIFAKLGLEEHLSPSRRNGLNSMVEKIKYYAGLM